MKKHIKLFITSLISCLPFFSADHVILNEEIIEEVKNLDFFTCNFYKIGNNYENAYGITASLFFIFILFFYKKTENIVEKNNPRLKILSTICGVIFSILIITGYSLIKTNSLDLLFYDKFQFMISIINFIGYFLLFKRLFIYLIEKTKIINIKQENEKVISKHSILFCFAIFMLCWMPYIIIFYPGPMNYDSLVEINQFYGVKEWTTHHPVIPTIIYGTCMKIGKSILNDNMGLFINNIIQVIVGGLIISYCINNMYKIVKNKKIRNALIIFFALCPIIPIHLYTEVKDIWFMLGVLLYFNLLMKFVKQTETIKIKEKILFSISMIIIYCFRNNGIYLILFTIPFLFILKNIKIRNSIIVMSIVTILFCYCGNLILIKNLKISKGSVREVLAIPLQQTARYIMTYDLTQEEKEDIEKLINIEDFKANYNPESIDIVKQNFKVNCSKEDLKNYFIRWWKMLLKHPGVYISATLNSTYGYFYPDRKEFKDGLAQFEIDTFNGNKMNLDIHLNNVKQRNGIESFINMIRNLPFVGLFFSCGFYSWLIIIITLVLIYYRKYKEIIPLVSMYIIILVCVASPVNAYLRYMLPIIISMPFIMGWTYYTILYDNEMVK